MHLHHWLQQLLSRWLLKVRARRPAVQTIPCQLPSPYFYYSYFAVEDMFLQCRGAHQTSAANYGTSAAGLVNENVV